MVTIDLGRSLAFGLIFGDDAQWLWGFINMKHLMGCGWVYINFTTEEQMDLVLNYCILSWFSCDLLVMIVPSHCPKTHLDLLFCPSCATVFSSGGLTFSFCDCQILLSTRTMFHWFPLKSTKTSLRHGILHGLNGRALLRLGSLDIT